MTDTPKTEINVTLSYDEVARTTWLHMATWERHQIMQKLAAAKTGAPSAYVLLAWRYDESTRTYDCRLDLREDLKSPYLDRTSGA